MNNLILAGDIGGTNFRIALFSPEKGLLEPIRETRYPTADYETIEDVLTHFVGTQYAGKIGAACFGVAGPVADGRVELTNIPHWAVIDERKLRTHLGTAKVSLINDMIAMGYGVMALPPERFLVLNEGKAGARGNVAIIAAGTGLGEGYLHWDGAELHPSPSEGGHTDFGPTNDLEDELLAYLRGLYGHVSYERILSGPGIYNIYQFLLEKHHTRPAASIAERLAKEDPSAVVAEMALAGKSALCEDAIDVFMRIYGAEAGNMALKGLTTGGVYVGGGIAPKLLARLRRPDFIDAFLSKGRFRELLQSIPVKVIMEPNAPLFGAAYRAGQLLRG